MKLALSKVKALPFDFEAAVAKHIKAMSDHCHTVGEPAPAPAYALVDAVIKRVSVDGAPDQFIANYEIIDDTPAPPSLDERKASIAAAAGLKAVEVANSIIPPLKRRLWDRDHARIAGEMDKVRPVDGETHETWKARAIEAVKKAFPADYANYLAHEDRRKKVDAITHHLAVTESQIHDLTEQTIDDWKPAPFPA